MKKLSNSSLTLRALLLVVFTLGMLMPPAFADINTHEEDSGREGQNEALNRDGLKPKEKDNSTRYDTSGTSAYDSGKVPKKSGRNAGWMQDSTLQKV